MNKITDTYKHPLFYVAILGIFFRYAIGLYSTWSADEEFWYRTSLSTLYGTGLYERMYFAYPPVWGFILSIFVKLGALFFDPANFMRIIPALGSLELKTGMISRMITSPSFNFLFKTPLFISDFLVGYILFRFVYDQTGNANNARAAFIVWFFNPLLLFAGAVHGMFDVIATLFVLLAVISTYNKNYFWAGATLALGVLTKLFPIYFAPLLLGIIISASYNINIYDTKYYNIYNNVFFKIKRSMLACLKFFMGAGLSVLIIFLPLIINGSIANLEGIFRRTETGLVVGGISPWFIVNIPKFNWIANWAYSNPAIVLLYSNFIEFSLLFGLGITAIFLGYKNQLKSLFYGSVATLSIVYLTAPIVNPQYLIWIIPFLTIVSMIFESRYKHIITIITFSGLLFYFSLVGTWHLLLPMAIYSQYISMESIISATDIFWEKKGFLNLYFRDDLKLISGFLGVTGIYLSIYSKEIPYKYIISEIFNKLRERRED